MTRDIEKNSPTKLDMNKLKLGLSKNQMNKIEYECDLLRIDTQKLLYVAPHLFNEGVTASNTSVIKDIPKTEVTKEVESEEELDIGTNEDYEYYTSLY